MISTNKIIGSLVYRTREALDENDEFKEGLLKYPYHDNCLFDDHFHLWHFVGTHTEIANTLNKVQGVNAHKVKFPAIFDFVPVREDISGQSRDITLNVAIAGIITNEDGTETREDNTHIPLLRPIYHEFMRQVKMSGYFKLDQGISIWTAGSYHRHTKYDVFTTGSTSSFTERYGYYIDAIEIQELRLSIKQTLCDKDFQLIEEENSRVTENIANILKS